MSERGRRGAKPPAETPALPRRRSLGYMVNHAARLFARALQREIAPLGLVPGQFPALLMLWEQDGLTQGEIARRVEVEQPTMANTLARMERDGLIVRTPDPADARRAIVRLTARGRALEAPAAAAGRRVNARAAAGLAAAERETLLRLLGAAIAALEPGADVK
ncbi:MAG: MarR family transcriptional regulator [Alphaproteobacteria bacterium]|nr:MarR family transcriptional regulator [Alphaproteobacteria bacterium]